MKIKFFPNFLNKEYFHSMQLFSVDATISSKKRIAKFKIFTYLSQMRASYSFWDRQLKFSANAGFGIFWNLTKLGISLLSLFLTMKTWKKMPSKVAHNQPQFFFTTGLAAQTSPELIFHTRKMSQDSSVYWSVVPPTLKYEAMNERSHIDFAIKKGH